MFAQWLLLGLASVGITLYARHFVTALRRIRVQPVAISRARKEMYESLVAESPDLASASTAQFLLNMAIDLHDRQQSASRALDDRAQALLGFVGGGSSLYALLGGFGAAGQPALTPLLGLAGMCFLVALVLCLWLLLPGTRTIPDISVFNSVPILKDDAFQARISHRLIDKWETSSCGLSANGSKKGLLLYSAMVAVAAGAILLVLNLAMVGTRSAKPQRLTNCSVKVPATSRVEVSCVNK